MDTDVTVPVRSQEAPAPTRVTMLNKYYPPHLGGIEYHMRDLAAALAARGHQVRVVVANNGPTEVTEMIDGVAVTRLPRAFHAGGRLDVARDRRRRGRN